MGQATSSTFVTTFLADKSRVRNVLNEAFSIKQLRAVCFSVMGSRCSAFNKADLITNLMDEHTKDTETFFKDILTIKSTTSSSVKNKDDVEVTCVPDLVLDSDDHIITALICSYSQWLASKDVNFGKKCTGTNITAPSYSYDSFNQCPPFYRRSKGGKCCVYKPLSKLKAAAKTATVPFHIKILQKYTANIEDYNLLLKESNAAAIPGLQEEDYIAAKRRFEIYAESASVSDMSYIDTIYGQIVRKLEIWAFQTFLTTQETRNMKYDKDMSWTSKIASATWYYVRRGKDFAVKVFFILLKSPVLLWIITKTLMYWKQKKCDEYSLEKRRFEYVNMDDFSKDSMTRNKEFVTTAGSAVLMMMKESKSIDNMLKVALAWLEWLPVIGPFFTSIRSMISFFAREAVDGLILYIQVKLSFDGLFAFFSTSCKPISILDEVEVEGIQVGTENEDLKNKEGWGWEVVKFFQPAPGTPEYERLASPHRVKISFSAAVRKSKRPPPNIRGDPTRLAAFNQQSELYMKTLTPKEIEVYNKS